MPEAVHLYVIAFAPKPIEGYFKVAFSKVPDSLERDTGATNQSWRSGKPKPFISNAVGLQSAYLVRISDIVYYPSL